MTSPAKLFEDCPLADPDEFLNALSPRSGRWGNPSGWIYRGQANADWDLRAKAMRDANAFADYGLDGDSSNWSKRSDLQNELLSIFREGLNRSALVIPTEAPRVTFWIPAEIDDVGRGDMRGDPSTPQS